MVKSPQESKKRDTNPKRETILTAALQVFQEEGYDNASMDKIALIADASKRTVYNHFASKDELFQAVIAQFLSEHYALKEILFDPKRNLEDQLSDFADAEIFLVNTPTRLGFSRVLTSVFIRDPAQAVKARAALGTVENSLERWLKEATIAGKIEAPDPSLAAKVFYAMIEGAITYPALFEGCVNPVKVKPLKQELIETFLCRYRKTTVDRRK